MAKKAIIKNGIQNMNTKLKVWIKNKDWNKIERELEVQKSYIINHKKQIEHEKEGITHLENMLKERKKFLKDIEDELKIDIEIEETNIFNLRAALNRQNPKKPETIPLLERMNRYQDETGEPAYDKDNFLTEKFRDWELIIFKDNKPIEEEKEEEGD